VVVRLSLPLPGSLATHKEFPSMSPHKETFTLGVEEEYQIIDPTTYELSSSSGIVLPTAQRSLGEKAQTELQLSQVEAATPVCQDLQEVRAELIRMRSAMIAAATRKKKLLAAAGTHPFSHWRDQRITPKERYKGIATEYKQLAREPIFGCHVHVGLEDREMALQVMNRASIWLAPLLSLTANSPFWLGEDTGYASFRTMMWSRWPTSGLPPSFASLEEYNALLQALIASKTLEDATKIYWDIRLSERFKTIEFRVADCCLTVDEVVMLVGLIRALVQTCYQQVEHNDPVPSVHPELLKVAQWRAARYGIRGELIDVIAHRSLPAEAMIGKMLTFLQPALEASGDWGEIVSLVNETLRKGNGAMRQRAAYKQHRHMEDVVEFIIAETRKGIDEM
jgi:carboxylate-amine ligase